MVEVTMQRVSGKGKTTRISFSIDTDITESLSTVEYDARHEMGELFGHDWCVKRSNEWYLLIVERSL